MQNKMYFSEVMVEVVIVCKAITMKWDVWFNAKILLQVLRKGEGVFENREGVFGGMVKMRNESVPNVE